MLTRYDDGLSQREIARRVGVSRKTVKRYIKEYETLAQADPENENQNQNNNGGSTPVPSGDVPGEGD